MAKVLAPNKQYNGISAGVGFVNGVGECTNPYLIGWFKRNGYEVEEVEPEPEKDPGEDTDKEPIDPAEEVKEEVEEVEPKKRSTRKKE